MYIYDGLLSVIVIFAIAPIILSYVKEPPIEYVEKKIFLIFIWAIMFFFFRTIYLFLNLSLALPIIYLTGIFFLLSVALYFEALLRKHYRWYFKLFLASGTLIFSFLAITDQLGGRLYRLIALSIFVVVCQLAIVGYCLTRDKSEFSKIENKNINMNMFMLILSGPFFLSDSTTLSQHIVPPLASIAILILSYVVMSDQILNKSRFHILKKILQSLAIASVITFIFQVWIIPQNYQMYSRLLLLIFSLLMTNRLFSTLKNKSLDSDLGYFVQELYSAKIESISGLLYFLKKVYIDLSYKVLTLEELKKYDCTSMEKYINDSFNTVLVDINSLREDIDTVSKPHKNIIVQILDLLQSYDKTHLLILGHKNKKYILFEFSISRYSKNLNMQANILNSYYVNIENNVNLK